MILTEFGRGPINLLVSGGKQMQAADEAVDGLVAEVLFSECCDVDDAGMATTSEDDQAFNSIEDQALIFGDVVFDEALCG